MYHPLLMYDQAKLRIAEDHRKADYERLVRQAGAGRRQSIDATPFRERLARLFGTAWPTARSGAASGG